MGREYPRERYLEGKQILAGRNSEKNVECDDDFRIIYINSRKGNKRR